MLQSNDNLDVIRHGDEYMNIMLRVNTTVHVSSSVNVNMNTHMNTTIFLNMSMNMTGDINANTHICEYEYKCDSE